MSKPYVHLKLDNAAYIDSDNELCDIDGIKIPIKSLEQNIYSANMQASKWSSSTYSISVSGLKTSSNCIVSLAKSATKNQCEAAAKAMMRCSGYSGNTITVVADGEIPSVDIPIEILSFHEKDQSNGTVAWNLPSGSSKEYIVPSASAPSDTGVLWIDTANGGITKYYNGSTWVATAAVWG